MSVADILEKLAENAGRGTLARGQILGNTIASAAALPGQIYAAKRQDRLDALKEAQITADLSFKKAEGNRADAQAARQATLDHQTLQKLQQEQSDREAHSAAVAAYVNSPANPANPAQHDPQAGIDALKARGRVDLVPDFQQWHDSMAPKVGEAAAGTMGRYTTGPKAGQLVPDSRVPDKPVAPTAEQDDQNFRNILARKAQGFAIPPADQAWADAYKTQKTLGVDASAGAAADRQTAAIGQQNALQKRAQDFNVAQVARKDLTVVEKTYTDAQAAANMLRDTVDAAQSGNKIAASMQTLQTAMAGVKAAGFNRINMAEIGIPGTAGSFMDRLAGRWGKLTEGQPVPADLQRDMKKFADLLERTAYSKYADGFDSVAKFYGLTDQQKALKLQAPSGNAPGDLGLPPGLAGLAGRK